MQALYEELHRNAAGVGAQPAAADAAAAATENAQEGEANAGGNHEGALDDNRDDPFGDRLAAMEEELEALRDPANNADGGGGAGGGPGDMWFRLSLIAKIAFFTVVSCVMVGRRSRSARWRSEWLVVRSSTILLVRCGFACAFGFNLRRFLAKMEASIDI